LTDDTRPESLVDRILALLHERGGQSYFGEPVTQLEHALQAAALAETAGAPATLVVAALLHDIGHLLGEEDGQSPTEDARHEDVGNHWLADHFNAAVTEPVRLHVAAKRYLCAIEPAYAAALSQASQESLALQGGPMSAAEARAFADGPWAKDAAALRRWDDAAKIPGRDVPGLSHYRSRIAEALEQR